MTVIPKTSRKIGETYEKEPEKTAVFPVLFIAFGLLAALLTSCGNSESEDAIPMGRYTERDVTLPGNGYEYMHPLSDGGYYLHGNGVDFTKIDASGEIKKKAVAMGEQL